MARHLIGCSVLIATLAACSQGIEAEPPAVYSVRARAESSGGTGDEAHVTVTHEAIPTFKDRKGEVSGMPAMSMTFGVAPGLDAAAFTSGSLWALTVDVVWTREPALRILTAKPLPPDTQLELLEAR